MRYPTAAAAIIVVTGAAHAAWAQVPAGGEFQVNTYTTGRQQGARLSASATGDFTVAWSHKPTIDDFFNVHARSFTLEGAPVGDEFRADGSDIGVMPATARGHNGTFVVFWTNYTFATQALDIHGARFRGPGVPVGPDFQVSANTSGNQYRVAAAALPSGGAVAVWSQDFTNMPQTPTVIQGRRYDSYGVAQGVQFVVNAPAYNVTSLHPSVAAGGDGRFVVAWAETRSSTRLVSARLFDPSGAPVGTQITVGTFMGYGFPSAAMAEDGAFVVAWEVKDGYFGAGHVWARTFSAAGAPAGPGFEVPANTGLSQRLPHVAAGRRGEFVVTWSRYGPDADVMARRFTAAGAPRGAEFRVNSTTTFDQGDANVASDAVGNFVVTWTGRDASGYGVFGQRFGGLVPAGLSVDTAVSAQSDGNGVLEPGETADVRPAWRNVNGAAQSFTGTVPQFSGPAGATYSIADGAADYGTVANGATAPCVTADCYRLGVSAPAARPAQHWDAVFHEDLAPEAQGQRKAWRLHVGDSFADVPRANTYYRFVETLVHNGIAAGCTPTQYCPLQATTREQMAVFAVVAHDPPADPPPACGTPVFADVPASSPSCRWIEELVRRGVLNGCGGGNFCPTAAVTREQMAVFMLRTLDGTLIPPPCTTPFFVDVPASSPYCRWIEELARRGVISGCGGGRFCPTDPVTRDQMAVFISGTFGLRLYGPQP